MKSVACVHFERLPIPPEYLPDPLRLPRHCMQANDSATDSGKVALPEKWLLVLQAIS